MRLPLVRRLLALLWIGLLSDAPAAGAEVDLVPPVAQLFAWNATHAAPGSASCAADPSAAFARADARRRAALARIAALVQAEPGRAEPLNGRGYAYPVQRDGAAELRRVILEAQRQRSFGRRD